LRKSSKPSGSNSTLQAKQLFYFFQRDSGALQPKQFEGDKIVLLVLEKLD
jgi:hypothetical protein